MVVVVGVVVVVVVVVIVVVVTQMVRVYLCNHYVGCSRSDNKRRKSLKQVVTVPLPNARQHV